MKENENENDAGNVHPILIDPPRVIGEESIKLLEEILNAARAGRVTAFAIVAKENSYARWSHFRAFTQADRYNIVGQLEALKRDVLEDAERAL